MGKKSRRSNKRNNGRKHPSMASATPPAEPLLPPPVATLQPQTAQSSTRTTPPSPQAPRNSDLSSTKLAEESYCMACGTPNAQKLCQCAQVSFCNADCAATAWPVHRLTCSAKAGEARKTGAKFRQGDIVKIHGLASETGLHWNGCLAEIQSFNKDKRRYVILFSTKKPYEIKSVLAKRENLELHLAIENAANAANEWDAANATIRYVDMTCKQQREINSKAVKPHRFIRELEQRNQACLLAVHVFEGILGSGATPALCKRYLELGLAPAVLKNVSFPLAIDTWASDIFFGETNGERYNFYPGFSHSLAYLLEKVKDHSTQSESSKFVKEIFHAMGPYILIMCSGKRRLFGSLNYWCAGQAGFVRLLGQLVHHEGKTLAGLVFAMPNEHWMLLMEHLVLLVSVDHNKFLQNSCSFPTAEATKMKWHVVNFMSLLSSHAAESDFKRILLLPIPFGAQQYTGSSFASAAPKLFARMILDLDLDSNKSAKHKKILASSAASICTKYFAMISLEPETRGTYYSLEDIQPLRTWEEYVGRSKKILQLE